LQAKPELRATDDVIERLRAFDSGFFYIKIRLNIITEGSKQFMSVERRAALPFIHDQEIE
jgi:hypothetical protein